MYRSKTIYCSIIYILFQVFITEVLEHAYNIKLDTILNILQILKTLLNMKPLILTQYFRINMGQINRSQIGK